MKYNKKKTQLEDLNMIHVPFLYIKGFALV